VRITARDQFNNTVTGFGGTVSITSSGALVGAPVTSGAFVNGVLVSESVTITSAQSGTTLTATGGGGNGTSNGFTVNPAGINNFLVEAAGGSNIGAQTAGVPFNIWITARDQFNNTVVNFAGGVTLSSNASLTTPLTATFTGGEDGVLEVDGVVLTLAGQNKEITVTGANANLGTSNDFTVNPGGVANFLIEKASGGDIDPQTAHTPFDIWITARDAFNNTVINFTGPVAMSTDAGLITPDTVVFDASDSGIHQASVTVTQAGTNKHISASSDADTGTSNPFTVNKATATVTLDAATLTQTYDGIGRVVTATTDPAGLTVHVTYDGSPSPPISAGMYAVVATIDDEGYEGSASGTLTVSKRPITVTAEAKTKVYGDPEPALTYHTTIGSLAAGDAFTGALTRVAGESVGTYAIQQGTLALTNNYVLTYVGATLSITGRPITVTADAKTKVYGDPEPALTYHITSGFAGHG
jgi:YD repeat-containing protein